MKDRLEHMFELQDSFQKRLGTWDKIQCESDKQQFINQMILAAQEEIVEIMRTTKYKCPECVKFGWKKTQVFDQEHMQEEIIDLWHFIMNLAIVSGMDSTKFYETYCKKNNVNFVRQDNNY